MIHVVYFNQWFSSIGPVIEDIKAKAEKDGILLRIIGSSTNPDHAYKNMVDKFYVEDWSEGSTDEEMERNYISWVTDLCKKEGVDLFLAKKHSDIIVKHQQEFDVLGTKVITCAEPISLKTKKSTYKKLGRFEEFKELIPEYFESDSYELACDWVTRRLKNGKATIMKLNEDEGGTSYKEITLDGPSINQIKTYYGQKITLDTFKKLLNQDNTNEFIIMEYLKDPEISVDCYNTSTHVIAIAREKSKGRVQRVFIDSKITKIAEDIARTCISTGELFNFQLRYDKDGQYKLLEINSRISGGAYIEVALGINLMYMQIVNHLNLHCSSKYTIDMMHRWILAEGDGDVDDDNNFRKHLGSVTKIEDTIILDKQEL
ncbi:MAG: ATP-grasp domain-containing protein [Lachnospiraceae bacterium]|nr:ATP-grasp domain-containing protein [Lachnospiraceae bacterium]